MRSFLQLSFLATVLLRGALAYIPEKGGYRVVWADDFNGGDVNEAEWNHEVSAENDEQQTYQNEGQVIGTRDGHLYINPRRSQAGNWYSGRIASWKTFTCTKGHRMTLEAEIQLGDAPAEEKHGLWPAFWALGSSIYGGKPWPKCGEWDIMEAKNGESQFVGVLHYGEDSEHQKETPGPPPRKQVDPTKFHKYAMEVDRQPGNWQDQSIKWFLDGENYQTVKGSDVGNFEDWVTLAHSPYYALFNIAVGGPKSWPGSYDEKTAQGARAGMVVNYFSVYETN